MKIKISELKNLAKNAILKYGYTQEETKTILEILMYAQLRDNNHGVVKLINKDFAKDKRAGKIKILKETKTSVLLDGNYNNGMVVMKKAMEIALKKVKVSDFAIVGTNNTYFSTGAIGYYVKEIARKGYIGFAFSSSPPTVCHYGSYEPKYGTNPLAIGIPTKTEPLVLDMATAVIPYYGLIEAKAAGRKIPKNLAYDRRGNLTTDPAKAMFGAILPFDRSYKGAGLAMMIEILAGALTGASFVGIGKGDWGNLIIAINPGLLYDIKEFKKRVEELIKNVKNSKKLPGVKEILVPGEKGNRLTQERLKTGEIEIEENLYRELKKLALDKS